MAIIKKTTTNMEEAVQRLEASHSTHSNVKWCSYHTKQIKCKRTGGCGLSGEAQSSIPSTTSRKKERAGKKRGRKTERKEGRREREK
jgi:hypothetical protein